MTANRELVEAARKDALALGKVEISPDTALADIYKDGIIMGRGDLSTDIVRCGSCKYNKEQAIRPPGCRWKQGLSFGDPYWFCAAGAIGDADE